jgi:hypothetical protein
MKKIVNISITALLVMGGLVLLLTTGCEEEDDYNYKNIEPKVLELTGPSSPIATGVTSYPYDVPVRGGSTYEWEVQNLGAEIVKDSVVKGRAHIKFDQTSDSTDVVITVTETTAGGKTASLSDTITALPYCPMSLADWEGNYTEYADDASSPQTSEVTITTDPNDELFGLIIEDFGFQSAWWGGYTGAKLNIKLNNCVNVVNVPAQTIEEISDFLGYGKVSVTGVEPGSFSTNPKHIEFTAEITVSAGSFGEVFYTYDEI